MGLFRGFYGICGKRGVLTASIGLVRRRILGRELNREGGKGMDLAYVCDLRGQSLCSVCRAGRCLQQMH